VYCWYLACRSWRMRKATYSRTRTYWTRWTRQSRTAWQSPSRWPSLSNFRLHSTLYVQLLGLISVVDFALSHLMLLSCGHGCNKR